MDSRQYWDKKIIEWEDSINGNQHISFVERIAAFFRQPLKARSEICMALLVSFAGGKSVLDLGCGSGFFSFELYDKAKPKHIFGIDISGQAIRRAQKICKNRGLDNFLTFLEGNAALMDFPETDIVIGLGFLDYLTAEEIRSLFQRIKGRHFLFSFSEKINSPMRYIHMLYLLSQRCPKHFYYTKDDIVGCAGDVGGEIQFLNDDRLSFACIVHNLPTR